MPGVIAPLTANVAAVVVVPVKLDVSLLDDVLICTVYPSHAVQLLPSFLNVIVTLFELDTLAPDVIVSVAPTVYDEPLAVIVVDPCFNVALVYPDDATDLAHTLVPANITVFAVNAVPVDSLVESYLVVNVVPVPWLLLTVYDVMFAPSHTFPAASFAHK